MLLFLISAVSAADVDDANVLENSSETVVAVENVDEISSDSSSEEGVLEKSSDSISVDDGVLEASKTKSKKAVKTVGTSFNKVSKSNYIKGNTFSVKLVDENGVGIANKTVYFKVNKVTYKVNTTKNGVAKLNLDFKKGIYTVKYSFNGTGYKSSSGSKKILLLSKPVSTIKGYDRNFHAGIRYVYSVTLKADGIPLSGRNVKFTINKKTYTKKTNSNGVAKVTLYERRGTYTIKYSFAGESNINSCKGSSKVAAYVKKNPYGTRSTVIIDADGGFTKAFLNEVANRLRIAGWKVIVKGIGPGQHSINYKLAKNCVYMPFYNGMCAGTILEMGQDYYGGVIKRNKAVLAPAWYTKEWTNPDGMLPYRYDISKMTFLKRAWDDNFSPSSFKGMGNPAQYMTDHGIKYCVGDTTYMIVEQFVNGGWVAHH
jgi:hypothetical protein